MTAGQAPTVWRRAAIYGSLWAASEIVVGSFLHNLRIPFAGSLLAAFGVLVMTAGHRAHPERGLIWRSAVVCALMKSISPSAVILGPMVGIAMEGAAARGLCPPDWAAMPPDTSWAARSPCRGRWSSAC